MKRMKAGVVGAGGRMGRELAAILETSARLEPYFGVHGKAAAKGFVHAGRTFEGRAADVAVWIDFSSPEGLRRTLDYAVARRAPVVSGTTGLDAKTKKALATAAKKIPVLWASNMSVGLAVLREALAACGSFDGFDLQIEEIHHRHKKDAPSGTALTLQADLQSRVTRSLPEPLSVRAGGVIGVHRIVAASDEEMLVFEHNALNRAVFARGAVRAAEALLNRAPGLYSMRDILKTPGKPARTQGQGGRA